MTTRFVVALRAEARPLIDRYRLESVEDWPSVPGSHAPFRAYRGRGKSLVISGIGKVAAAAATAWSSDGEPLGVWVNVGIAGHRDRAPGELVRASRITDASTKERFYPTLLGLPHIGACGLTTVDAPEIEFASSDAFDMEAAGFYPTALRFSTSELVQCLKIISDNSTTGTERVTAERVEELVERELDTIDEIVSHLESLAAELEPNRTAPDVEPFTESWHFTTSQRRRLRRLLARCRAFGSPASADDFRGQKSASAVMQELDERLRSLTLEQSEF